MECNLILGWVFNPSFDRIPYNINDGHISLICKRERGCAKAEIWYNSDEQKYYLNCHADDIGDHSLVFDKDDAVLGRMIYYGDMFVTDVNWRLQCTDDSLFDCYSMEKTE